MLTALNIQSLKMCQMQNTGQRVTRWRCNMSGVMKTDGKKRLSVNALFGSVMHTDKRNRPPNEHTV